MTRQQVRKPKHNLPSQPTPFIGRAVGSDGSKRSPDTRSTEYTSSYTDRSRRYGKDSFSASGCHRSWSIALQMASILLTSPPIREPEAVLMRLPERYGIRETSDRPLLDEIKAQLRLEAMLLLLDNFEQVTAAAPKMGQLLQDCPQLEAAGNQPGSTALAR